MRKQNTEESSADLFEVAVLPLFPVHHIVEDWNHDIPHLSLRYQRDSEEGSHHPRYEVGLVLPWEGAGDTGVMGDSSARQ